MEPWTCMIFHIFQLVSWLFLFFFRMIFYTHKLTTVAIYMCLIVASVVFIISITSNTSTNYYLFEVIYCFTIYFFPIAISILNLLPLNTSINLHVFLFNFFCIIINSIYFIFMMYLYSKLAFVIKRKLR